MTKLEIEIVEIVRRQGLKVLATHGEHHLLIGGLAFLNLTTLANRLDDFVSMERADAYAQGAEDERASWSAP
jgi:hypothetical protein